MSGDPLAYDLGSYPGNVYNMFTTGAQAVSNTPSETNKIPTTSKFAANAKTIWHKDSPMLVLGLLLAVTVGAASVSGSARIGKAKAAIDLGTPK